VDGQPLRIMSLHVRILRAVVLLEEVEETSVADERAYMRRLHVEINKKENQREGNVMVRPEVLLRRKTRLRFAGALPSTREACVPAV
jgi:hypothetical protein